MGKLLEHLAAKNNHEIIVVIDESQARLSAKELSDQLQGFNVAIDFTIAHAVRRNVEACLTANVPLVEGTTGWSGEFDSIKSLVREKEGALCFGANFSIGVNLFYRVADFAAELFAKFEDYETFIEEQHHSAKKDAPSGTALKLKSIVSEHIKKDFSLSATRAGYIPGTHRVGFDGAADQILLEHQARSREGFAVGALMAAEWIIGKTGVYEFTEVIDEILQK